MANVSAHPKTAQQLIKDNPGMRDTFILALVTDKPFHASELATVTEDSDAIHINITPDMPIAVWDAGVRDEIYTESGIFLPTRKEIGNPELMQRGRLASNVDWDNVYTMATGPFLWVSTTDDEPARIHLLQNTMTKPVNKGRFNTPSGLVSSRDPFSSFFNVLNTQPSIIAPTASQIMAYGFEMPKELAPALSDEFRTSVLNSRTKQDVNIRAQLDAMHANKAIMRPVLPTRLLEAAGSKPVVVTMLSEEFVLSGAHCAIDGDKRSANVHFPVHAQLPHRLDQLVHIDAQGAGSKDAPEFRNTGLYTLEDAKNLDTIPAPEDYLHGLTSAPA